jgi:hypothetical protein
MYESVNLDENKNKVLDRDISSTEVLNRVLPPKTKNK